MEKEIKTCELHTSCDLYLDGRSATLRETETGMDLFLPGKKIHEHENFHSAFYQCERKICLKSTVISTITCIPTFMKCRIQNQSLPFIGTHLQTNRHINWKLSYRAYETFSLTRDNIWKLISLTRDNIWPDYIPLSTTITVSFNYIYKVTAHRHTLHEHLQCQQMLPDTDVKW